VDHIPEGVDRAPSTRRHGDQSFDFRTLFCNSVWRASSLSCSCTKAPGPSACLLGGDFVLGPGDLGEDEDVVEEQNEERGGRRRDQEEARQRRAFRLAFFRREQV